MPKLIDALRKENEQLKLECSALRSAFDKAQREHEAMVVRLTTEVHMLKRQLFGPKAERVANAAAQQSLFDILVELGRFQKGDVDAGARAESLIGDLRDEISSGATTEPASERLSDPAPNPPARTPKRRAKAHGRQKLNESQLPVERIVIEPLERRMPGGELLVKVGEEVSSHLDYRASSVVRVEVARPKYLRPEHVCTSAASNVPNQAVSTDEPFAKFIIAEPPELPIAKGMAGAALLALVLVMKYADHQPLHRQERIFKRQGVRLPRSTLCGFVQGCTSLLRHVVRAMWDDAKKNSPLLLTDACGVLILAKERCKRGAFQVFIAPGRHVHFAYLKENNGDAVAELLDGFLGKLQSDASSVYHETYRREPAVIEVGCWAHARRNFFKALASDQARALVGIGFIGELYDAHNAARDPNTGLIDTEKRRQLAEPILDDFRAWIQRERHMLIPSSPIEVALGYIERQWSPLTRFLVDGSLRLDNNLSELELRHQVVGRKNWLFCATDGGAEWNAVTVSLIASCRMHDIEPHGYLRDVLTLLPGWETARALELAPAYWRETAQTLEVKQKLQRLRFLENEQLGHGAIDIASAET